MFAFNHQFFVVAFQLHGNVSAVTVKIFRTLGKLNNNHHQ